MVKVAIIGIIMVILSCIMICNLIPKSESKSNYSYSKRSTSTVRYPSSWKFNSKSAENILNSYLKD